MKADHAVLAAILVFGTSVAVWTQTPKPSTAEVLRDARRFALQARSGSSDISGTAMLSKVKEAITADPANSELHRVLGDMELLSTSGTAATGTFDVNQLLPILQRATAAYERAAELDPNNALAISERGLMTVLGSFFKPQPELAARGLADLTRAVEMAPTAVVPRLNRAFTTVNLPPAVRTVAHAEEDLKFLTTVSEGSRPGDMIHLLLADLYFETGRIDEARVQYEAARRRPASALREQVASRLTALEKGSFPAVDVAAVRGRLASDCLMCHAK